MPWAATPKSEALGEDAGLRMGARENFAGCCRQTDGVSPQSPAKKPHRARGGTDEYQNVAWQYVGQLYEEIKILMVQVVPTLHALAPVLNCSETVMQLVADVPITALWGQAGEKFQGPWPNRQ
jgi:hypothetical protein